MICTKKALMVLMLTTVLGLWGCSQGNTPNIGNSRLRELEAKAARLEDDYRTALAARDQARQKLHILEDQQAQLTVQLEKLESAARERDMFRDQIAQRIGERDALQGHLSQFSRDLQNLAFRVEQAAQIPVSPPSGSAMPVATAPQE